MAAHGDDLDLLLSLRDERVLETPPASPSSRPPPPPPQPSGDSSSSSSSLSILPPHNKTPDLIPYGLGYTSDDGSPRSSRPANMSVFRDAVKDYLDDNPAMVDAVPNKSTKPRRSDEVEVEKFSGVRIRYKSTLNALQFSFLGKGFSLSVYSASQMLKMGMSADYGICKGKRKDGMACTMIINKYVCLFLTPVSFDGQTICQGIYCKFHSSVRMKASQMYTSKRSELRGG
ncbi:hypothetical protein B296_00013737 [Ensete ventricosum]|uniref:Zinc finger Mcm10/DnaG-type domain-containing protein n=1 Tax=Ensete ventricosum TaxID=4639 RepID=A0A426YYF5_ENSVE|nr:hypothetical protein B296_00013737 [Ensete ventricosum]